MKLNPDTEREFHEISTRVYATNKAWSVNAFNFAMSWARRMEERIDDSGNFERAADYALEECNPQGDNGITIMQYVHAVEFLYHFWEQGDELRRWHNRKFLSIAEAARVNEAGAFYNPSVLPADKGKLVWFSFLYRDYMLANKMPQPKPSVSEIPKRKE